MKLTSKIFVIDFKFKRRDALVCSKLCAGAKETINFKLAFACSGNSDAYM